MDHRNIDELDWKEIVFGYVSLSIGVLLIVINVVASFSQYSAPIPNYIVGAFVLIGWLTLKYS